MNAFSKKAWLIGGALFLFVNSLVAEDELWSRGLLGAPSSPPFPPFTVTIIESTPGNHLVATCTYANYTDGRRVPPTVTIRGVRTNDGKICPRVTAKVANDVNSDWRAIGELGTAGRPTLVRIVGNTSNDSLTVPLDIFRPFIGQFEFGSLVLKSGEAAVFELRNLLSPEQQLEGNRSSALDTEKKSAITPSDPQDAAFDGSREYRRILESKLFVTRADCARINVVSSSKPEIALSVYSRWRHRSSGRRSYYVTMTEASRSIQQSLLENDVAPINVDRRTAKLPAATAVALRKLWKKMLSQANPNDTRPDFSVNGEALEFSLDAFNEAVSLDELPSAAKDNEATLRRLRDLLIDYCAADQDERATLATQIRKNARGLSNRL